MTPAELRRIAEAATPGPWELDKCDNRVHVDYVRAPNDENLIAPICAVSSPGPNAEFIATFNPQRVLELLDENQRLRARLAAVEQLHQPHTYDDERDVRYCGHCQSSGDPYAPAGRTWPCPTIKAARGE